MFISIEHYMESIIRLDNKKKTKQAENEKQV